MLVGCGEVHIGGQTNMTMVASSDILAVIFYHSMNIPEAKNPIKTRSSTINDKLV